MSLRAELAEHIRHVDGGNELSPAVLAIRLAAWLLNRGYRSSASRDVRAYIAYVNPDKQLSAAALADAIVDHFNIDPKD